VSRSAFPLKKSIHLQVEHALEEPTTLNGIVMPPFEQINNSIWPWFAYVSISLDKYLRICNKQSVFRGIEPPCSMIVLERSGLTCLGAAFLNLV